MTRIYSLFLWFVLAGVSSPLFAAQPQIITIESTITGSQEQPKVISIVPWQKPRPPEYFGEEITGLGLKADVFQSIDRESFNREMHYISTMKKGGMK
jgi:hypothetical protein